MKYIEKERVIECVKNYGINAVNENIYVLDAVDDIVGIVRLIDLIPTVDIPSVSPMKEVNKCQ